jgi:uncharacterized membrane protein YkoI
MLKHLRLGLAAAAVVLALALPAFANGDEGKENEQKVKLSDCPAAVQKTIKDNADGGEILEIVKETEEDATIYEAEVKKTDGTKTEIKVAGDGTLIKTKAKHEDDDDDDKK